MTRTISNANAIGGVLCRFGAIKLRIKTDIVQGIAYSCHVDTELSDMRTVGIELDWSFRSDAKTLEKWTCHSRR